MTSMISALEVRQRIAADHALLRSLIRALIAVSQAAERDESQRAIIRDVLGQLCCELERHFDYEEEVIVPLMRDVDAWGPARVEQLCKEHDHQREVLDAIAD